MALSAVPAFFSAISVGRALAARTILFLSAYYLDFSIGLTVRRRPTFVFGAAWRLSSTTYPRALRDVLVPVAFAIIVHIIDFI